MDEIIVSSKNKNIKLIKALQSRKYRDLHNQFIIEGEKLIEEAISYNSDISAAVFSSSICDKASLVDLRDKCLSKNIEILDVDDKLFSEICDTKTPQGVLAVVRKKAFEIDEILSRDKVNIILLDEVRDPGNLGTIVRTADACNLDAVILSKGCVDLYNSKTIRSTMGSIFHLPVIDNVDLCSLVLELNNKGIHTIGTDPYGKTELFGLPYFDKFAIIIGNESNGTSEEIDKLIEYSVQIPMPGKAESLNAGISAALIMYEMTVRKKYGKHH